MRRLLVWTWKEAREHAARVRLLLVSIVVLTLLAGWIWAEALTQRHGDELSFGFVAWALVLHGLVVASSLFASDVGESAPAPAQRLPGGLGAAFVAKGLTWFSTALVAVVVGSFATAGVLWLVGQPERAWAVLTPWNHRDGLLQLVFAGEALVYSACVALAAACVRHPGSAVACGTILFGLLLGGVLLGWRADPHVFPLDTHQGMILEVLLLGLLGLAVVAAWFVGRRRAAAGWRAAALAGGVIFSLYGAGAVHAARTIERAREPGLSSEDWSIEHAYVGLGGRYAFAQVRRQVNAWPIQPAEPDSFGEVRRVDLTTGTWDRLGRPGASLFFAPRGLERVTWYEMGARLQADERVVMMQPQDPLESFDGPYQVLWYDGASGALLHEGLDGYPDAQEAAFLNSWNRRASTAQDASGRTTWIHEGFLQRDDAPPIGIPPLAGEFRQTFPCMPSDDAWWVRFAPGSTMAPHRHYLWVDATTGRHVVRDQEVLPPAYPLSKGRLLVRRSPTNDLKTSTWQILDVESGATRPALGAPTGWPIRSWPVCRLAGDRILKNTARGDRVVLEVWDPLSGETSALPIPGLPDGHGHARVLGSEPRGRILLEVPVSGADSPAWVLLSADASSVMVLLSPGAERGPEQALCLSEDGSLVCLMAQRQRWPEPPAGSVYVEGPNYDRIVRVGPETDRIETLFPRQGK